MQAHIQSGNTAAAIAAIQATGATTAAQAAQYTGNLRYNNALDVLEAFSDTRAHAVAELSDAQKGHAAYIAGRQLTRTNGVPNNLTQNLISVLDIGTAPTIISDQSFDKAPGVSLFRTVYDSDTGVPSQDVIANFANDEETFLSGQGGSAHGRAIYFADNFRDSAVYGYGESNPMMMRCKLDLGTARTTTETALGRKGTIYGNTDISKLAGSRGIDIAGVKAILGGYDAYSNGTYMMVTNRAALTMSDKVLDLTKCGAMSHTSPSFSAKTIASYFKTSSNLVSVPTTGLGFNRQK